MSLLGRQRAWRIAPPDPIRAAALSSACGISPLIAQILLNRGIDEAAEARRFLSPRLDQLCDPMRVHGMAAAVERISRARRDGEPVLIFGDSDVDGVTAAAILYELLRQLGLTVVVRLSNRLQDGYGFPDSLLARVLRNEVRLVILVDCGTNQPDSIRALAERGIDTIVLDHHIPAATPAQPAAMVNPRCGEGPGRELCSAGLAFKLAQALCGCAEQFLDLAALGTLADYAPLIGDSRILAAEGLASILGSRRPGLRQLMQDVDLATPSPEQILRRLVPRLNAGGRLGEPRPVWRMLIESSAQAIGRLSGLIAEAHATTKLLHRQALLQAHEHADRLHFRDELVVVLGQRGWHSGVMGPIAAQLAERFARPAIAIALDGALGVGSGRSVPGFNLFDALRACEPWLVRYGGHAQACGLTLRVEELPRFREAINRHASILTGGAALSEPALVDVETTIAALTPEVADGIERLRPYGPGNPRPVTLLRRVSWHRDRQGSWLADAQGRIKIRGRSEGLVEQERYDVLAAPSRSDGDGQVSVAVADARLAAEGDGPAPMPRSEAALDGAAPSAPGRS